MNAAEFSIPSGSSLFESTKNTGSYMYINAHVLLNLLNKLEKRDKM